MVSQTRDPLCWMETYVPGGKGSCIGSVLLRRFLQVRSPFKRRYVGKFVIGNRDFSRRKMGG